ncbi:MAG: hypothetical protein HOI55_12160 [Candidatus Marinimicrobia bacterium]|jgi:hypothetical protein|nr:hypothetical protein [Candidatus Neomarinimicrobiota bacterium]
MTKYIMMILLTGFAYGQTDLDKLILKDDGEFVGEFSKIEDELVYFKPREASGFQPMPVMRIKQLTLKNGQTIVTGGIVKSLSVVEYRKLNTKEKAVHDANLVDMSRLDFSAPLSSLAFWGCVASYQLYNDGEITDIYGGEWWGSPVFLKSSIAGSLVIPYFILDPGWEFSYPESITDYDDKLYYKKIYSKKLRQRKVKYILGSTVVIGAVASLWYAVSMGNMSGFSMGGGGGNMGMGGYSGDAGP